MKANSKFIRRDDEAVSPVIAVILMVAITVVLAATVYVWVSGFGSSGGSAAKSLALSSAGVISHIDDADNDTVADTSSKNFTVSAATPGMKWSEVTVTLNGVVLDYAATIIDDSRDYRNNTAGVTTDGPAFCVVVSGATCSATLPTSVTAGQKLWLVTTYESTTVPTLGGGSTLRIVDTASNSVVYTLNVG